VEWVWVLLSGCGGMVAGWELRGWHGDTTKRKAEKSVVVDTVWVEGEVTHPIDLPDTSPTHEDPDEREWRVEQLTLAKRGAERGSI
jgi:hypothetical protein